MGEQQRRPIRRGSTTILALVVAVLVLAGACSSSSSVVDGGAAATTSPGAPSGATGPGGTSTPNGAAGTTPASGPLDRYADYASSSYDDPTHWVCRPDADDICQSDLDTTVIAADGTTTVEPFVEAADPTVDCFYVYPTISRDTTRFSDWNASPAEEGYVTLQQAARLRSVCRVFAPVYRQATLTSLLSRMTGGAAPEGGEVADPYADVLDAFRTYMANDNDGRGVVLIGHSQGAGLLTRLIAEEIDPNPDVRDALVSAYLAGTSVSVPDGADVGGSFQNVAVCREADQVGCVVTWSTYRATALPSEAEGGLFGRPRTGGGVAACANPAALGGGSGELHAYFPAASNASILDSPGADAEGSGWADPPIEITTPFVSAPGLVTGECVSIDGYNVLSVTVQPDPGPRIDDINGDLAGGWGLHLVDVNLTMGNIVDLVASQSAAFAAAS